MDIEEGTLSFHSTKSNTFQIARAAGALGVITTAGAFLLAKAVERRVLNAAGNLVTDAIDIALNDQEEQ